MTQEWNIAVEDKTSGDWFLIAQGLRFDHHQLDGLSAALSAHRNIAGVFISPIEIRGAAFNLDRYGLNRYVDVTFPATRRHPYTMTFTTKEG